MKFKNYLFISWIVLFLGCSGNNALKKAINSNMRNVKGAVVFIDLSSGREFFFNKELALKRSTPCSTFKIWNTLIGIECGLISFESDPFYKWDKVKRVRPEWNQDLTLKEAFRVSCVPAYQNLAQKIGVDRMQSWLNKISYGDRDISSGIDIFWLPRKGYKSIKISPVEQALLIRSLVNGQLYFSDKAKEVLKNIMLAKETAAGMMYGKTGSGQDVDDIADNNIGWYAGYVISKEHGYSFACLLEGKDISGKDARAAVENILIRSGLL